MMNLLIMMIYIIRNNQLIINNIQNILQINNIFSNNKNSKQKVVLHLHLMVVILNTQKYRLINKIYNSNNNYKIHQHSNLNQI